MMAVFLGLLLAMAVATAFVSDHHDIATPTQSVPTATTGGRLGRRRRQADSERLQNKDAIQASLDDAQEEAEDDDNQEVNVAFAMFDSNNPDDQEEMQM